MHRLGKVMLRVSLTYFALAYTKPSQLIPRNTSVIVRRIPAAKASNVIETQVKAIRGDEAAPTSAPAQEVEEDDEDDEELPTFAPPEEHEDDDVEGAISTMLQTASTWT